MNDDDGVTLPDKFGRPLRDLRISVTDRCNFRCSYCMPREVFGHDFPFLPKSQLLTFEEITRLARLFQQLGVKKIRLTGGEPLLRRDLPRLVEMLAAIDGIEDIALTTNGTLLPQCATDLRNAGLKRITVSLDTLDDRELAVMSDSQVSVSHILACIDAGKQAGFSPIKINMVVQRGVNEKSILPMARHFRGPEYVLRFIEFMDVGNSNQWRLDQVVPAAEIFAMIHAEMPLEPIIDDPLRGVATRFRYADGGGEIGMISSVTVPFCADCSRARLSADGALFTCLFASTGDDLRSRLREGKSDGEIQKVIQSAWQMRTDRYSELRSEARSPGRKIEMSYIGG
jgi:cyclic pyranopterin phosphate synthase